ncbi:11822_t:CDS:2 [Funneliformis caledonium]|uniref:11822_t:CDS:1 n=1 Tax=Funneliformis caledonium TaxID=1117310 RepID=A0A9N9ARJ3_9GLOM|nr:11822_t:CDS:2 [Funneliformis caledonium]
MNYSSITTNKISQVIFAGIKCGIAKLSVAHRGIGSYPVP